MIDKKPIKFWAASSFIVAYPLFIVLLLGLWGFCLITFLQGGNSLTSAKDMGIIFTIFSVFLVFCIGFLAFLFPRIYSVIEISEKGISKSLFKKYFRREINWEELHELRIIKSNAILLFASKTSLEGIEDCQFPKRKDTIELPFSKKMILAIRQHYNSPIINYSTKEENDLIS